MRFLISEIELGLSERDDLISIKAFLNQKGLINNRNARAYLNVINRIESYVKKVQNLDLGDFLLEEYLEIQMLLKNLGILIDEEQLFQVDLLHKPSSLQNFSKKDLQNINESIEVVSKITDENKKMNDLETFRKVFLEKYEGQSVPILEALDVDFGVGFPANESIGNNGNDFFNAKSLKEPVIQKNNKTNVSEWLWDKIEYNRENEALEIIKNDLGEISPKIEQFFNTFFVVGQFVEDGKILLQNVGGVIGNTLLSRFSYLDESIEKFCNEISDFEKNSSQDIILADIIWIENSKAGNISRRISNLDYEIPLLNASSKKGKYKLELSDLQVSIHHNEVILTSKKHKKRVIPILSNAHNFRQSLNPIYKFLSALQYQNKQSFEISFDFQSLKKRYFPRIFYKNIIISPACWIIQKSDIKQIKTSNLPIENLKEFFNKWNVPQFVLIVQGDNDLLIDTHNPSFLEILLNEIQKGQILILKEWLYCKGNDNINFTNQFILPLKKCKTVPISDINIKNNSNPPLRTFFPGSDWVYFKIYCSTNFSNIILKKIYREYIVELKKNNIIEKWFFIRYADPHQHLRLRIKKTDKNFDFYGQLKKKLNSFQKKDIIWKIKIDTYQRELERYGMNDIDYAEDIFFYDSENYTRNLIKGKIDNFEYQISFALQNLNFYLSLLNLSYEEKMYFCEKMKMNFAKEKGKTFIKEIDKKFREIKNDIFVAIKNETSFKLKDIDSLRVINLENVADYIHMSINRCFVSNQRDWEYYLYYIMYEYNKEKFYKSK